MLTPTTPTRRGPEPSKPSAWRHQIKSTEGQCTAHHVVVASLLQGAFPEWENGAHGCLWRKDPLNARNALPLLDWRVATCPHHRTNLGTMNPTTGVLLHFRCSQVVLPSSSSCAGPDALQTPACLVSHNHTD